MYLSFCVLCRPVSLCVSLFFMLLVSVCLLCFYDSVCLSVIFMSVYLSVSFCVNMSVCVSVAARQVGIEGEGVGSQTAGLSATGGRAGGPGQRESGRYGTMDDSRK